MRFRNLLAAISVFTACVMTLASQPNISSAPVVLVKGLLMLQLEQKDGVHIAVPEAPGHKATITFVMRDRQRYSIPFKGHSVIQMAGATGGTPVVKVPELVRMKELYADGFTPRVERSPNSVVIPWGSIAMVSTDKVTDVRYTFVRADNGEEIVAFRPRNIAESIRIDLSASGKLNSELGKARLDLGAVAEIRIEQLPAGMSGMDMYTQHFYHYFHYIDRAPNLNFDVEPRKVSAGTSYSPRVGQSFWNGTNLCGPLAIN